MERIYLDTNILVALAVDQPSVVERKSWVISALNALSDSDHVTFVVSTWTLTEMVKVLINEYSIRPKQVAILHNGIIETNTFLGYEFEVIQSSVDNKYTIEDLFIDVREIMTNYSPGWGDAIHSVIMRNNSIKTILSSDSKDDFKIIPGFELIHPKDIEITD